MTWFSSDTVKDGDILTQNPVMPQKLINRISDTGQFDTDIAHSTLKTVLKVAGSIFGIKIFSRSHLSFCLLCCIVMQASGLDWDCKGGQSQMIPTS